jgi:hypothetical protein
MRPPHQLRLAISAVTDEPVSWKNATENAASAAALLTTAIVKKTISTIADDDDRFVAGIFVFVFAAVKREGRVRLGPVMPASTWNALEGL